MSYEQLIEDILRKVLREEMASQANGQDCQLLTADEVAGLLGYDDRASVYKLRREGLLKAVSLGDKTVRFSREDVRRFIAERTA